MTVRHPPHAPADGRCVERLQGRQGGDALSPEAQLRRHRRGEDRCGRLFKRRERDLASRPVNGS